jgi:hypothetical protein
MLSARVAVTKSARLPLDGMLHMPRSAPRWTQSGWGPSRGPNGGVADALDEAKVAFH